MWYFSLIIIIIENFKKTGSEEKMNGSEEKGLLWKLPVVKSADFGKLGPGFALGAGCGLGFGVGLLGGISLCRTY